MIILTVSGCLQHLEKTCLLNMTVDHESRVAVASLSLNLHHEQNIKMEDDESPKMRAQVRARRSS